MFLLRGVDESYLPEARNRKGVKCFLKQASVNPDNLPPLAGHGARVIQPPLGPGQRSCHVVVATATAAHYAALLKSNSAVARPGNSLCSNLRVAAEPLASRPAVQEMSLMARPIPEIDGEYLSFR
jgi:hypothetical protein